MKILNINSYYYSSTVHKQFSNVLQARKIDFMTYVPLAQGYVPREECQYSNETHVLKSECYNKFDRYVFHIKHNKILRDIQRHINVDDFDCLHAHSLFSNGYIALKLKEQYEIPYIVAVRDTDLNTFFKYMIHLRKLGIKILEKASKIVFLSDSYRKSLIQNYVPLELGKELLDKSVIIPNGINDFWINNKNYIKKTIDSKNIKLLYVGAISKRKNIVTTVKAIEVLRKKGYNISFTVVGKIEDNFIFNKIKDLPYLKYIEPVQKEELIQIYRDNDIFVMPSITETFGLVYAEAMSQGLPVIYTKGQGFDGQFEDGVVGYSVDCFNVIEISNRIIDAICRYREISKNCIELCDKFNWSKIVDLYLEIYDEIY